MPFVFILVGVLMLTAGVRGKSSSMLGLVEGDLTGAGNYVYWMVAIGVIGGIGYVKPLQPVSRAALVLVLLVLVLKTGNPSNGSGGLFNELSQAMKQITSSKGK